MRRPKPGVGYLSHHLPQVMWNATGISTSHKNISVKRVGKHPERDMSVRPFFKSQFTSMKAYKYRLYADKATTERLQWILDRCRELYNAALDERKSAYRIARKSIGYYEQKRDLVEIKESICPEYQDIASHVLQDVIAQVGQSVSGHRLGRLAGEEPHQSACAKAE
jgi:Helix-turn-helix domain